MKIWKLVVGGVVAVGLFAVFFGGRNGSETPAPVATETSAEGQVNEQADKRISDIIPSEKPDSNTTAMVDYLYHEAKVASRGLTDEEATEAVTFIAEHYPNYFGDNETMEQTMYNGYLLECAYKDDESDKAQEYAQLGTNTYQAVKYVYRDTESVDDDHTQENLRQIKKSLKKLGHDVAEGKNLKADDSDSKDDALAKAKIYSDDWNFSKAEIYQQLISEDDGQFTEEEAQYAIDNLQADYNNNALEAAKDLANELNKSQKETHDLLIYSEFTEEEVDYAMENLDADYKANALETAKDYYEKLRMSKNELYEQLVSDYGEKFTPEEAQYAIDNLE